MGQGKPLTTTNARWHQVVAGALRGGAGQHRGFHFDEALVFEEAACGLHRLVAQAEVAAHALAAQVQVAVPQAQLLAHLFVVVHRDRKWQVAAGGIEHLQALGQYFHLTGGQALIAGFIGACAHPTFHLQHRFIAQVLGNSEGFSAEIGIHRDLHGATAIAQVDEDHPAMVAAAIHPAAEQNGAVDGIAAQIAAGVAAHGGGNVSNPG